MKEGDKEKILTGPSFVYGDTLERVCADRGQTLEPSFPAFQFVFSGHEEAAELEEEES